MSLDNDMKISSVPPGRDYSVSQSDANLFVKAYHPNTNYVVTPICEGSDTLFYIYNFLPEGWLIVAGDRRIDPIIGESLVGNWDIDVESEARSEVISSILELYEEECSLAADNEHTRFWNTISKKNPLTDVKSIHTKNNGMKWCVVRTLDRIRSSYEDVIPHLIQTKWGQSSPWNYKLPIDLSSQEENKRCYIGCTSVAVSQMIFYLHNYLHKPNGLYHNISCNESILSKTSAIGFSRSEYVSNSTRWEQMPLDSNGNNISYVTDLMLDVGNRLVTKYSASGSSASVTSDKISYYNLSLSSSIYKESIVRANLNSNLPVIIVASDRDNTYAHAWIIDGIRKRRSIYTYSCHVEYSENWQGEPEYYDTFDAVRNRYHINDEYDVWEENTSTTTEHYLMNWGYDGRYDEDIYTMYGPGTWVVGPNSYVKNKQIYYDFR